MNNKKLKRMFLICLVCLILSIIFASCNFNKPEESGVGNTDVESSHIYETIDYNNLTESQKSYMKNIYSNNVRFTEKGVEVYNESDTSGKLLKIISSKWPESAIGNLIPSPNYGKLDRVEYSENFIKIYINDAKQGDTKAYLKELKKYNFDKDERKNDGDIMLEYKVFDDLGNFVVVRYLKQTKTLEISANKAK